MTKNVTIRLKSVCHPDRFVFGRGLCCACYTKARKNGTIQQYRRLARFATCHPDMKHKAHGLCQKCYEASDPPRRLRNPRKAECHPDRAHASKGLCKTCYMAAYAKDYRANKGGRDYARATRWKSQGINLTTERYNEILADQGGVCAICFSPPKSCRLAVDHDHETGNIRGILCDYCNRRLLIRKNTIEVLKRAIEYLERSKTRCLSTH